MVNSVLAAIAVLFLGMGISALIAPTAVVRPFGVALSNSDAPAEVRAVYGGFGVAIAVLLGAAAVDVDGLRPGAVWAVAVALAGMAFGRLVARLVERPTAFYPVWFYFWVEVVVAAVLVGLLILPTG
jgi:hypothetical protein